MPTSAYLWVLCWVEALKIDSCCAYAMGDNYSSVPGAEQLLAVARGWDDGCRRAPDGLRR